MIFMPELFTDFWAGLSATTQDIATFAVLLSDFRSEDYLILACFGGFGVGLSWLVLRCLRAKPLL